MIALNRPPLYETRRLVRTEAIITDDGYRVGVAGDYVLEAPWGAEQVIKPGEFGRWFVVAQPVTSCRDCPLSTRLDHAGNKETFSCAKLPLRTIDIEMGVDELPTDCPGRSDHLMVLHFVQEDG